MATKRKTQPQKSAGKVEARPLTPEEVRGLPPNEYLDYLTQSGEIESLTGASPLYTPGKLPRGFFGERLNRLTAESVTAYAKGYQASPDKYREQNRGSKYPITVEIKPESKKGRKVIPAEVVTLPNGMGMVNAICTLTHGDYHPNRAIKVLESLPNVKVGGDRPLSFDNKAYLLHRAQVEAQTEAARIEAKKVEAISKVEALFGEATNKAKRRSLPAQVEAILGEAGIDLKTSPGKSLYQKASRISRK